MEEVTISTAVDPAANPSAFVGRYQHAIWLWLRVLGCNEVLADDLTQETLIKAILQAEEDRLEARSDGEMVVWLRTAAKHLFLSHQRKQHRRDEILRADAAEVLWQRFVGDASGGEDEWLAALSDCLTKLQQSEGRLANAIDLHYAQGFRAEGVADALGVSVANVYTMMHRARGLLRRCIEGALADD